MIDKSAKNIHTDDHDDDDDEGIAFQMLESIIGIARVLRKNYKECIEGGSETITDTLKSIASDEDLAWLLTRCAELVLDKEEIEDIEELKNDAQSGTTQPTYIDESGKVFTATDIVSGYKPKGSYKGYSMSERVNSDSFGKSK